MSVAEATILQTRASPRRFAYTAPTTLTGGGRPMDTRDLFLDQHALMHSAAVGGNKMSSAERTFAGLSDEQMRVRPREDLNSLAWLLWHIARAEDILVNVVVAGRTQVCD